MRERFLGWFWIYIAGYLSFSLFLDNEARAELAGDLVHAREKMVRDEIVTAGIADRRVIRAMTETPRHEFVALKYRHLAYLDMSLPIGIGQTISSPFIVAFMTESLNTRPQDKVLEIGTGSGYQAAVLSSLVREVYTIEIVESLAVKARRTLRRLKYDNVHVKFGDGYQGWAVHAPFDKIIVTCSPENVPQLLIEQLADGGRLIVPVGERYQQTLYLFRKQADKLVSEELRPTLFVPMTGAAEQRRQVQPDPLAPQVVNGGFEAELSKTGQMPGWYYQRQFEVAQDTNSPAGEQYVTFRNTISGRPSRALQGFGLDGRRVVSLELSAWVKYTNVTSGGERMLPMVALSLYDENRRELGRWWIGPWRGTSDWRQVSKRIRIPSTAREGILRIGLFGATGEISLDDVQMRAILQKGVR